MAFAFFPTIARLVQIQLSNTDFVTVERFQQLLAGTQQTVGMTYEALHEFARDADLLLDISGMLSREEELIEPIPERAFVDLDPGFNQVWHETGEEIGLAAHNRFVTVGQAIGTESCPVPTCGVDWIPRTIVDDPVVSFQSASEPPGRPAQQPPTITSARGCARRHETRAAAVVSSKE